MNFQGLTFDVIYSFYTSRTNISKKKAQVYSEWLTDGRYVLAGRPCRFFTKNLQTGTKYFGVPKPYRFLLKHLKQTIYPS